MNITTTKQKVDLVLSLITSRIKVEWVGDSFKDITGRNKKFEPQLVWLSGLRASLRTERSPVDSRSGHMPGLQARSLVRGV